MSPRLNPLAVKSNLFQLLIEFGRKVVDSGLEPKLVKLVKIRASQINGCANCLDMHTREALKIGETQERLFMLDAWRESQLYNDRERAALAWTESVTLIASTRAPDEVYAQVQEHFSEDESIKLTMLIGVINVFNRICVAYRITPMSAATRPAA